MSKISAPAIIQMRQELMADSKLTFNYLTLVLTSCLIATLGLLSNSGAVIIGAMLVAPLMLPLRGLAFGALEGDPDLFRRSFTALATATGLALILSIILGRLTGFQDFGTEVLARTKPTLIDLAIAVVAGGLSGFSKVRPQGISDAIAGTAIAVALMPPLCATGLTLSQGIWSQSYGTFLLYFTNLLGITVACMLVFILAGYAQVSKALGWALLLTGGLIMPLGLSFLELVSQAKVEHNLKRNFTDKTFTGRRVELLNTNIIWTTDPPQVYLRVRADKSVTPKQVRLVQEFLIRKMNRNFELIFMVDAVEQVKADLVPVYLNKPPKQTAKVQPKISPSASFDTLRHRSGQAAQDKSLRVKKRLLKQTPQFQAKRRDLTRQQSERDCLKFWHSEPLQKFASKKSFRFLSSGSNCTKIQSPKPNKNP